MTAATTHPSNEALVDLLTCLIWTTSPKDKMAIRNFIARHRLVQMPEEPIGWQCEWEYDDRPNRWYGEHTENEASGEALFFLDADKVLGRTTGRIRPIVPGEPIPVQQEGEP